MLLRCGEGPGAVNHREMGGRGVEVKKGAIGEERKEEMKGGEGGVEVQGRVFGICVCAF